MSCPSEEKSLRVFPINEQPVDEQGRYILYWMTAQRRLRSNFALERAATWSRHLQKPLLVFEGLRCDYPWASDRIHAFVLNGMRDNLAQAAKANMTYFPWLERAVGQGKGLLRALAQDACVVITDHYPCFFLPHMVQAAGRKLMCRLESVDSNCITPLASHGRAFPTAHSLRRHLQKNLRPYLLEFPATEPIAEAWTQNLAPLPQAIVGPWAPLTAQELENIPALLRELPINHQIPVVPQTPGGSLEAGKRLTHFVSQKMFRYIEDRNQPMAEVATGLSPRLHFGHISPFEVVQAVLDHEGWNPGMLSESTRGSREGWWGLSAPAESFLDQVITWRTLGYNTCHYVPNYDKYESLPEWARITLELHASDPRPSLYTLEELDQAQTHDPIWNAAQRQLRTDGIIHNYMRMLWGKKIVEWSASARAALTVMIELNNRYALDGRDPNSYSGIFWVLGRHDRAWGPERPIFGKVRYMSSDSTRRKLRLKDYLEKWS